MSADPTSDHPMPKTLVQDPDHDAGHHHDEQAHDHETEVRHAWEHFHENWHWFLGFLIIILITVALFNVNFGPYNRAVELLMAAVRSAFIAFFLQSLFKNFSFVFRTLIFTALFLFGMVMLSLWDSSIQPKWIGDPIIDQHNPKEYIP